MRNTGKFAYQYTLEAGTGVSSMIGIAPASPFSGTPGFVVGSYAYINDARKYTSNVATSITTPTTEVGDKKHKKHGTPTLW